MLSLVRCLWRAQWPLWIFFVTSAAAFDDEVRLNDTFNNFITDFAPILTLFGSGVSQQFMSLSLGLADSIMFAIAPFGVLLPIVSAIRLVGSPGWLTFIGHAQESRAAVEEEVLSSTSDEVSECWEGGEDEGIGKVVRLQQKRGVKAIFYDDIYKNIYNLKTAYDEKLLKRSDETTQDGFEDLPPNLTLNVGGRLVSQLETWINAVIAALAQIGVLIIDGLCTYRWNLITNGSRRYGFPMTCTGSILLSVGMFCCAHIVETSTKKVKYTPTPEGKSLRLLWLQKGLGQYGTSRSGFAIERQPRAKLSEQEILEPIWVSKKVDNKYNRDWMVVGVALSVTGWIMQAEGLRWMHWIAPILQLCLTLAMLLLRARLRRSLATNPKVHQIHDGHEIDWFSMAVAKADQWEVSRIALEDDRDKEHNHKHSQPTCDIVIVRTRLAEFTLWGGAADEMAQNLANCIQKTYNYLANIKPIDMPRPAIEFKKPDRKGRLHWSVVVDVSLGQSCQMQEKVHFDLPPARIPEPLGKERWGPWKLNVEALKATLSLWTYNFKKALDSHHRNGEFVFVIGPSRVYSNIYRGWFAGHSPENPVYVNMEVLKYPSNSDDLHQVEFVGRNLPYSYPIKVTTERPEYTHSIDHLSEENEEYLGYQYKSHAKSDTINSQIRLIQFLGIRVYAQHLFASFMNAIASEIKMVDGKTTPYEISGDDSVLQDLFTNIAKIFVDNNMGTQEEAYTNAVTQGLSLTINVYD